MHITAFVFYFNYSKEVDQFYSNLQSGFGGLEVACWPGSNPAEAVGFFWEKKYSARLPSEGK